jgi:hypothetical protein
MFEVSARHCRLVALPKSLLIGRPPWVKWALARIAAHQAVNEAGER